MPQLRARSLSVLSTVLLAACGPRAQDAAAPPPVTAAAPGPSTAAAPDEPAGSACEGPGCIRSHGGSTCAVLSGEVLCWGAADRLGQPSSSAAPWTTPRRIPGVVNAVSVAKGMSQSCALGEGGEVTCWGDGAPRRIPFSGKVVEVAVGSAEEGTPVYALLDTGAIQAVDVASPGQPEAVQVPDLRDVVSISASHEYACAVHRSGTVSCWGWAVELLGAGLDHATTPESRRRELLTTPVLVHGVTDAVGIATSYYHACALRRSKQIVCWGHNAGGELGSERAASKELTPVLVPGLADAVEVTAGEHHSCARRESGKVTCWGDNTAGQLGAGPGKIAGPADVKGIDDARAVSAGDRFSCALRASGAIACWGSSARGRLGNGNASGQAGPTESDDAFEPVPVSMP